MLKGKKIILFDLDGVLTETKDIHFRAFHESLKTIGILLTEEIHIEKYDGLSTKLKLEYIRQEYNLNLDQVQLIDQIKQSMTVQLIKKNIKKDMTLIEIFTKLHTKYKMCVCSNARRESLDLTLDQIGITNFFDFTLSQQDVKSPKPSPDIYLKALEIFQAKRSECLIFEDSQHGIVSAEKSGIDFIRVNDSYDLKNRMLKLVM